MADFEDMFTIPLPSPIGGLLLPGRTVELDLPAGRTRAVITDIYIENYSDADGELYIMGDAEVLYKFHVLAKGVKIFNYITGLRIGSPATSSIQTIQITNPSQAPLWYQVSGYFSA
jgi:hypothetical protein